MGWVRISDDFYDHPRFARVSGHAIGLWLVGLAYANRNLTDGFIPTRTAFRLVDGGGYTNTINEELDAFDGIRELVAAGLWVETDAGYEIRDYLQYQPSADQVRAQREKNARRQATWRGSHNGEGNATRNGVTNEGGDGVTDEAVTGAPNPNPKGSSNEEPSTREPTRTDVERLCRRLSELMVSNGCKPPTITHSWRNAARLLLDTDHRPLDEALRLLEWCQKDDFWKGNVQSLPKFRAKYDQLRLKAGGAFVRETLPVSQRWMTVNQ